MFQVSLLPFLPISHMDAVRITCHLIFSHMMCLPEAGVIPSLPAFAHNFARRIEYLQLEDMHHRSGAGGLQVQHKRCTCHNCTKWTELSIS